MAGIEPARLAARDFKSLVSTYFTTLAKLVLQVGLEPTRLTALASKTSVATNYTTRALNYYNRIFIACQW